MKTPLPLWIAVVIITSLSISKAEDPQWDTRFITNGLMGTVNTLDSSSNYLYAGGYFTFAGNGRKVNNIARWDGTEWIGLGEGFDQQVMDILVIHDTLIYAAGYFTHSGSIPVNNIARWDGVSWQPLSTGTSGGIRAIETTIKASFHPIA